jgi:hypothetical protein
MKEALRPRVPVPSSKQADVHVCFLLGEVGLQIPFSGCGHQEGPAGKPEFMTKTL